MSRLLERIFHLKKEGTTIRTEFLAGVIGFFAVVYIIVVNSSILSEAGVPEKGAALATIFISAIGCLFIGLFANVPLILMPGMGINALFTYTFVHTLGLSWQTGMTTFFISGLIFIFLSFTTLAKRINDAIPLFLKQAITIGLGLFLILIGLEKGELVIRGKHSLLSLGNLSSPFVLATVITLILTMIFAVRKVPGGFLWSLVFGTMIGFLFGVTGDVSHEKINFALFREVFLKMDFHELIHLKFWISVFLMTMVIVFETVGLTYGQLRQMKKTEKLPSVLRVSSIAVLLSGVFGTSPTISALESGSMQASGAKTGFSSVIVALFFISTLLFMPFLAVIPNSAIAPILIVIGIGMVQEFEVMRLSNAAETFSALTVIVFIPFTYSIADGIAAGFILYPILQRFIKNKKPIHPIMYIVAALFLLQFILQWL